MNWIKIDVENLPNYEVLAINAKRGILFGFLNKTNPSITCTTANSVLLDVIYYIEEETVEEDFKDFIRLSEML